MYSALYNLKTQLKISPAKKVHKRPRFVLDGQRDSDKDISQVCRDTPGLGKVEGGQEHRQRGPRAALRFSQHSLQLAEAVVHE